MSINFKPVFPLACFLAWLFFVVSCEKPDGPPDGPETPNDTTIIVPGDTVITPTDTIIIPSDTIVTPVNTPLALFTVSNNYCTAICSLSFTNLSVYADTYTWDFGDGSATSTATHPFHIYSISGTYRVILTSSKSGQSDSDTQMVEIKRPVSLYAIGSSKNEFGTGLVQTGDGGYVVAGSREAGGGTMDVYLFKTDASRNVIWEKQFGGSGYQTANAIRPTSDGGFVIVGGSSGDASGFDDVYLAKTDGDGNLTWQKKLSSSTKETGEDVTQTNDGGFLITGRSQINGSATDYDLLLMKTDLQGNVIWEKHLGTPNTDGGYAIQRTSDDHFIVAGYYDYGLNVSRPYMIKIDNAGDVVWEQHNVDELNFAFSVQETFDGGFIWAGTNGPPGSSYARSVITKTDASGAAEWSKKFLQPGYLFNQIECVRQTSDGGYIVCGQMDESGYDFPVRRQILVIKTDATGVATWTKTYAAGGRLGNAYDIQQTPDGGYIVVGHMLIEPVYQVIGDPFTDYDVYLLKLDADGNPE
jgi:PKD repeat protein